MTLQPQAKKSLVISTLILGLAVFIGAFGAHGLKNIVTADKLVTFETGVRYQFYHGFALLMVALTQQLLPMIKLQGSFYCFLIGILLFSFNCYFYVLSDMKVFAMIVPVGGLLFILGWLIFFWKALKLR
jgi:uncharacterized membrane protein YgdD (TMEM256/DUF423 family)